MLFPVLLVFLSLGLYALHKYKQPSPIESSVLNDPALDDSPLTQRDGRLLTLKHAVAGVEHEVRLRIVHVSASTSRNPTPAALPTIVLVHGLGGQLAQFDDVIDFLAYFADVLAIDLPGSGGSPFDPALPRELYSTPSLVRLVRSVIDRTVSDKPVVLVGHSLGTAIACFLALSLPTCAGLVAICPPTPLTPAALRAQSVAKFIPPALFDLFRYKDRRGGLHSPSVDRMLGQFESDQLELKVRRKQLRWNLQVNTRVWLNMASTAQLPTFQDWANVTVPVCLIGAQCDKITPPDAVADIAAHITTARTAVIPRAGHMCLVDRHETVCGIMNDFFVDRIDPRLSLGWQLADMATRDDKWSLKNEEKWRHVQPVSPVIARFRAMKTLRQHDPHHNPSALEHDYPDITDVIDISREEPPYDPSSFARIKYHKFSTISKIPPTRAQVDGFIALVDSLGPDNIVGVHCHYGFNRTGFFICSYMIQRLGMPVRTVVEQFAAARPPGIKHPHFVDELFVRYM